MDDGESSQKKDSIWLLGGLIRVCLTHCRNRFPPRLKSLKNPSVFHIWQHPFVQAHFWGVTAMQHSALSPQRFWFECLNNYLCEFLWNLQETPFLNQVKVWSCPKLHDHHLFFKLMTFSASSEHATRHVAMDCYGPSFLVRVPLQDKIFYIHFVAASSMCRGGIIKYVIIFAIQ